MSNKPKTGDHVVRGVLRSQKQARSPKAKPQTAPAPTQRPMTRATVTLASGEKRTVKIEATNDKEWSDLAALAEGGGDLSLDQKDMTHRTIAAIVALRIAHDGDEWKPYCVGRGMKWRKEAKSPFQPAVMWVLNRAKEKTGENHTSKASMIAGCIDDIWEYEVAGIDGDTNKPIDPLTPDKIAEWLSAHGSYTGIYGRRRGRNKEPADKREARYRRFLSLPPIEQRDIPDWLGGFDGDVVIAAHVDTATGKIDYRSVWQPEGSAFWQSKLDQFIAARPDYGKAVEPVRMQSAEPMFDRDDGEAKARSNENSASDRVADLSAMAEPEVADEITVEQVAEAEADLPHIEPQSGPNPAITEMSDNTDTKPLNPEALLTVGHSDWDASMADVVEQQRDEAEAQTAAPAVQIESEAPASGGPLVCKLASGCRSSGCQGQDRCLAH